MLSANFEIKPTIERMSLGLGAFLPSVKLLTSREERLYSSIRASLKNLCFSKIFSKRSSKPIFSALKSAIRSSKFLFSSIFANLDEYPNDILRSPVLFFRFLLSYQYINSLSSFVCHKEVCYAH
tara:strand:- start:351926 stop:352297 length:372 start_codon:yes stop_codon:yes gene_type:complete